METSTNFTDKELAQLRSIISNNPHKALEFMHECAEVVGVADKKLFADILGLKLRTVQDQCKDNKLKCFLLGNVKYPAINCNI